MPEIIDPVFTKTSPKRSFCMTENERFGLVFTKTGSINSGIGRVRFFTRKKFHQIYCKMWMEKILNEGNKIHNILLCLWELLWFHFITVPVLLREKFTVPTVPVPQHCWCDSLLVCTIERRTSQLSSALHAQQKVAWVSDRGFEIRTGYRYLSRGRHAR